MIKIMVVEDDARLNMVVCKYLRSNGFEAIGCLNANDAYNEMYNHPVDLVVSDVMMPEIDGFEFAETLRKLNDTLPIIFMTALDDIGSKQRGFRVGIDDYMVKPVDMDELVMRIQALLRRARIAQDKHLTVGNLMLDADAMTAAVDGQELPVTVREFNILYKLLSYPGKSFTRNALMDEFWDADSETSLRTVDTYVARLRDKFSACTGFRIVTVHGLGYKAVLS